MEKILLVFFAGLAVASALSCAPCTKEIKDKVCIASSIDHSSVIQLKIIQILAACLGIAKKQSVTSTGYFANEYIYFITLSHC